MRDPLLEWGLAPVVQALQAMRGVQLVAAMTLVAELQDFLRFDNPRQLMAYVGLVPGEHPSGPKRRKGSPVLTVGIDTAKSVFAVHGVDEAGGVQLRQPKVARAKLKALIASLPPCTIGIEACTGAHHWARQFQAHGHVVRLMVPEGRHRRDALG